MKDRVPEPVRELTARDWAIVAICVGLAFAASVALAATYLDGEVDVDGDIVLQPSDSGPRVNFSDLSNEEAELAEPFPDDNTIQFNSTAGNITISAGGQVIFDVTSIEGTWTNATNMSESSTDVTLNPYDKQEITINGSEAINFKDVVLDDGTEDFEITSSGGVNLTVTDLNALAVSLVDSNGNLIDSAEVTGGSTTLSFTVAGLGENTEVYSLKSNGDNAPRLSNSSPVGNQDDYPTTISIDVNDTDFPDDTVNVDFDHNGNDIQDNQISSNQTRTASVTSTPGKNTVTVTATDDLGNSVTESWSYTTAANLTIRQAVEPYAIIDDRQVNATFFEADGDIVEKSTTDGNITMDGIDDFEHVVIALDAASGGTGSVADYHDVENLVIDFGEQQDVYMLNASVPTHTVRFTLEDRTGGTFENNNASVIVQKPINQTDWDNPRWETVFADQFGPAGASTELEQQQRYRIKVRNDIGDERVLGTYTPEQDETVPLEVGDVNIEVKTNETWSWNASYDDSAATHRVRFALNDTTNNTNRIWIEVYEFNNESNVLVQNQSFAGDYGTFSFAEPLESNEENKSWVFHVVVERDGDNGVITQPVGTQTPVLQGLSENMRMIIAIGTILVVAGLFSQLNGHIGGLIIAGLGGIFWYIGFMPPGTGVGIVILAMIVAAILFIRERARGVTA